MNIIKKGICPGNKKYNETCNNCKTEIEFLRSEARFEHNPRNEQYLIVDCPICNKKIYRDVYFRYAASDSMM